MQQVKGERVAGRGGGESQAGKEEGYYRGLTGLEIWREGYVQRAAYESRREHLWSTSGSDHTGASAGDKDMALKIYQSCNASGKVIGTLAEKGDFNALVAYTGQTGQKLDYMFLLQVCVCACVCVCEQDGMLVSSTSEGGWV